MDLSLTQTRSGFILVKTSEVAIVALVERRIAKLRNTSLSHDLQDDRARLPGTSEH